MLTSAVAEQVELPTLPPAQKEAPAPKAQAPPTPAVDSDPGAYLRSLIDTPAKPVRALCTLLSDIKRFLVRPPAYCLGGWCDRQAATGGLLQQQCWDEVQDSGCS